MSIFDIYAQNTYLITTFDLKSFCFYTPLSRCHGEGVQVYRENSGEPKVSREDVFNSFLRGKLKWYQKFPGRENFHKNLSGILIKICNYCRGKCFHPFFTEEWLDNKDNIYAWFIFYHYFTLDEAFQRF